MAVSLLSAAAVSGEPVAALVVGAGAWATARLLGSLQLGGGVVPTLLQTREQADRACARGRFAVAKALYERAVVLAEQRVRADDPALVRDYYNLAACTAMLGDFPSAGRQLSALLPRLCVVDPRWSEHASWLLRYVAVHLAEQGDVRRARELAGGGLALAERAAASEQLSAHDRREALKDVGWILHRIGDYVRAQPLFEQALRSGTRRDGASAVSEVEAMPWTPYRAGRASPPSFSEPEPDAPSLGLAECLLERGLIVEGRLAFEDLRIELRADLVGPEFSGRVLRGLAHCELALGHLAEAERCFEQAYLHDAAGDLRTGAVALDLLGMAEVAARRGRLELVDDYLLRAEAMGRGCRPVRAVVSAELAATDPDLDGPDALARVELAIRRAERGYGGSHPSVAKVLAAAASVALRVGRREQAERWLARGESLLRFAEAGHPVLCRLRDLRSRAPSVRSPVVGVEAGEARGEGTGGEADATPTDSAPVGAAE